MIADIDALVDALQLQLQVLDATVSRNVIPPGQIPTAGLLILRDRGPVLTEMTASPQQDYYTHQVEIEAFAPAGTGCDAALDWLLASATAIIACDRSLGGLCKWIETRAPTPRKQHPENGCHLKTAILPVILYFTSATANSNKMPPGSLTNGKTRAAEIL